MKFKLSFPKITQYRLILLTSIFFVLFDNISFFQSVARVYPLSGFNIIYTISLAVVLFVFLVFLFSLLASKYTTKAILIVTLMVSSFTNYFMNTYNVMIDYVMIRNTFETNLSESSDLFSYKLVVYVLLLGVLPSFLVYKEKVAYRPMKSEIFAKIKTLFLSLLIMIIVIFSFSKFYTSFFREHKPLRYRTNPTYWIYSIGKYISKTYNNGPIIVKPIGLDAKIDSNFTKRKIVVMVVGESARANRFSLNGYGKDTNPLLKKEGVISFSNIYSCGTSTAYSVPCMFSIYDRSNYTYKKGISTQNVLDVLKRTKKVDILWRDNNSDSKNVALRVKYQDYKTSKNNTICQGECRDTGMIVGLDKFIKNSKYKDILIILHQMGNHGPAYYKRYPKEFAKFKPICKTNQFEQCTKKQINNSYDNAILYTDYFLSKVIDFLKNYSKNYDTAMLYMSDHGESLGENGVYLHGMPYFIAPVEQTHIGLVIWLNNDDLANRDKLKSYANHKFSQNNLFATLLGVFDVKTKIYDKNKDILFNAKNNR